MTLEEEIERLLNEEEMTLKILPKATNEYFAYDTHVSRSHATKLIEEFEGGEPMTVLALCDYIKHQSDVIKLLVECCRRKRVKFNGIAAELSTCDNPCDFCEYFDLDCGEFPCNLCSKNGWNEAEKGDTTFYLEDNWELNVQQCLRAATRL